MNIVIATIIKRIDQITYMISSLFLQLMLEIHNLQPASQLIMKKLFYDHLL